MRQHQTELHFSVIVFIIFVILHEAGLKSTFGTLREYFCFFVSLIHLLINKLKIRKNDTSSNKFRATFLEDLSQIIIPVFLTFFE